MTTERILYTDGHDVTVTDSSIRVKKNFYRLEGITRHGFTVIKPSRIPAFILSGLGFIVVALGISNLKPELNLWFAFYNYSISTNTILIVLGGTLVLIGVTLAIITKERYGVNIVTAEGEKNVVVSDRREYISMIIEALNKAYIKTVNAQGQLQNSPLSKLKMKVSPR